RLRAQSQSVPSLSEPSSPTHVSPGPSPRSRQLKSTCLQQSSRVNGVSDLVVDPTDPSTIYAAIEGTVLKSTDFGATWEAIWGPTPTAWVSADLAIDSRESTTIYMGRGGGPSVEKSVDGGLTWANEGRIGRVVALAFDPTASSLYAAVARPRNGGGSAVFRSDDGAATWSLVAKIHKPRALAIAGSDPSILIVGTDWDG